MKFQSLQMCSVWAALVSILGCFSAKDFYLVNSLSNSMSESVCISCFTTAAFSCFSDSITGGSLLTPEGNSSTKLSSRSFLVRCNGRSQELQVFFFSFTLGIESSGEKTRSSILDSTFPSLAQGRSKHLGGSLLPHLFSLKTPSTSSHDTWQLPRVWLSEHHEWPNVPELLSPLEMDFNCFALEGL